MIIEPPSALPALSAITRITTSVEPPAGQGQISLIGLGWKRLRLRQIGHGDSGGRGERALHKAAAGVFVCHDVVVQGLTPRFFD